MNQLNNIKSMILDNHQMNLFTYLFDPEKKYNITKTNIKCSYEILKAKKDENNLNKFLTQTFIEVTKSRGL